MKILIIPVVATALIFAGCTKSSVESASKEFNNLPAAVQKTVHTSVPTGEVADVDRETRDGRFVYQIKFRDSDRHPPLWVAEDGTIVKYEAGRAMGGSPGEVGVTKGTAGQYELSALPVPVQKAIEENAPRADVADIHRNEQNGRVLYDIEYAGKKTKPSIQISEDGTIVKPLARTPVDKR
jgi:uncharacterized membrane protein YkoI